MTRDISDRSRHPGSSASPGLSSLSDNDRIKVIGLSALATGSGVIAWSGEPRLLPVAFLFPALWALAPSRLSAVIVSAAYFLAASRGLPQGVANFYGSGHGAGLALWLGAALAFVVVHAVLWTLRPGLTRPIRYGVAALLVSVPPFGIVGWAHPITAAGILFPGWGWWGLVLAALGLLAATTRYRVIVLPVFASFWMISTVTWADPEGPPDWVGIDTEFGGQQGEYAGYLQYRETLALVDAAPNAGRNVVVLPESAAGIWTPTVEHLWSAALSDTDAIVVAGAITVDRQGYDNVMLAVPAAGTQTQILYRERMPVPVSMWQPWRQWTGGSGGARAHFFANPVFELAGQRVAPLICYEQLLIWPILQSAWHDPDVIVAIGNGWWTNGTNIIAIQKAAAIAWARLFGLTLVMAFNS
ncbi:conjugal transfer protein TraB [Aquamicrobium segne]|uniref:Conjugal transfer protein TraB n=1 Tax=Aquamicrobium segne TaxID=469547 RepID=A0ABW0GZP3_9HYPH